MKRIIIAAALLAASPAQAGECDPSHNPYGDYYELPFFGCQSFYHWDFTLKNTSARIDHASYGEGTAGGGVGPSADTGPAPDAGPAPDGPSPDAGPAADAGGDPDAGPGCDQ